ncbi:WhiB family transcriptional regulator [Arthrobacter sp. H41]|uniref:WhiB family transcriptional regulator n=1 Tax=Arthrobacter sp. H41 TaxID=1312978 RepID=UPI004037E818
MTSDAEEQQQAATFCADCLALAECRAYSASYPREPGVWAGTTEATREARAAAYRARTEARNS